MKIGAFLLAAQFPGRDHTSVLESTLAAAVAAESAGFDDVWLAEHHFMSYGVCPSAVTMAGFVLGRTRRIGVGTAVSVLSTQHPVALAEQANLLDQLSGGRFRLGVGRGGPWVDLEVFGTGLERYERDFPEALEVLLGALRGGRIRADGTTFGFREVEVVPGPRTRPHPPVVVAASSAPTLELAARLGLPLLLGMDRVPAEQAARIAEYAELAGDRAARGHVVTGLAHVADSRERAREAVLGAMPEWLGPGLAGYVTVDGRPRRRKDPEEYARFLCDTHAVGSPEDCAERLVAHARATGAAEIILMVEAAGDPGAVLDNIARLGAEVLPRVRAALWRGRRRDPR
ncbi:alkanesulfonate monooxygenase SsuD/methylene tetrahydromethanopterin reductase-like flavin-dependent oxidoreductase (luciferase family) [Spinactinospora alkalitolerans]|uniref:Alkanesulfonate monooxygenase SsuD/methylene tetrahydromethanopterin reductase-like flavin-dependent oxidoreductase (Luciferase family) n=1 Tax=Spinactinospora alkalitolerans TaxID=687207 RepID=A0A852U6A5_9ACTN|nr:LLM class flavin-dependent oxidoreductase [Spinactinospora alkalitolerans]NYE49440.1 alkanesulfonate monooxygenase SsuD/methylene tetrahydromethanopterin reductase-like flavin-dependent oxidoreductase (luciferase family) [Spinactinospora alkalitolerans]